MWAKFVVGSFSAPRGFSPGTPVFLSPQKPALLNSNSIRNEKKNIFYCFEKKRIIREITKIKKKN